MEQEFANVKLETFLKLKKLEEKIMEGKTLVVTQSKQGIKVSYFTESEVVENLTKEMQHLSDMNEALTISNNKISSDHQKSKEEFRRRADEMLDTNKWLSKELTEAERLYENNIKELKETLKSMSMWQFRKWKK